VGIGLTVQRAPTLLMETDVGAVTAGAGRPGWVSGSIANLALSASVNCIFDLGPDWDQYVEVSVMISQSGSSSGLSAVQVFGSDTAAVNANRRQSAWQTAGFSAGSASVLASGGVQTGRFGVAGRFLVVSATNADGVNAQGATSKITLAAYVA